MLAAFALQGCAYAPERQEPAPVVSRAEIALDAAASQPGLLVDETASTASQEATEQRVLRAQALEAEAAQLLREAQAEALASEFFSSLPPPLSLGSPPDFTLLAQAAAKRARAKQLSAELAQLKLEIAKNQRTEEEKIRKLRGTTGISVRDIENHGVFGGPNSAIRAPFGGGGGGGGGGGWLLGDLINPDRIIRNIAREQDVAMNDRVQRAIERAAAELGRASEKAASDKSATIRKSPQDGARSDTRPIYPPIDTQSSPAIAPSLPASAPLTPSAIFAAESEKIDGLVKGSAAVSAPEGAKSGDPFTVYLRVSPEKLENLIKGLKLDFPENQTIKGKQDVRLTSRMMATVKGFGFEISPKEGQTQAVSATEPTTWQWQVKAIESGVLTLNFSLAGTLTIEGKEVARNFYEYQQKVQVAVSPMGFVEKYWQWLATTLAIPAICAIWAALRKPKDNAGTKQPNVVQKLREKRRQRASV